MIVHRATFTVSRRPPKGGRDTKHTKTNMEPKEQQGFHEGFTQTVSVITNKNKKAQTMQAETDTRWETQRRV